MTHRQDLALEEEEHDLKELSAKVKKAVKILQYQDRTTGHATILLHQRLNCRRDPEEIAFPIAALLGILEFWILAIQ